MITLPHLPAPSAISEPYNGPSARAARMAERRDGAYDLTANHGSGRLRPQLLRPQLADPVDRSGDEERSGSRREQSTPARPARVTANLFFVQRFAQQADLFDRPAVAHARAAAAYPSLTFDDEILLPGDILPLVVSDRPRLDIVV